MSRRDWIGLGITLVLHAGLGLLFAWIQAYEPQPRQLGFIEVEFGPFAEGRPVEATRRPAQEEAAPEPVEEEPPPPEEEPPPEPQPEPPATEASEPVDLPDEPEPETPDEVPPADEEAVPPEPAEETQQERADPNEAESPTGAEEGDPGEGTSDEKAAPFQIEGLNRDPVRSPLPRYAEQVNATIRVRITVDPKGRIVRRIPLMKGNPALEQSVMEALARWRFNPLPPNAPQENQTGTITFAFRLE